MITFETPNVANYEEAWKHLMPREGGFVNNPNDPGKRTIYGIAEHANPDLWANGVPSYEQCMQRGRRYWDAIAGDQLLKFSGRVAYEVFENYFNSGRGGMSLQRCLNAMNRNQKDYADIVVDGGIGPGTLAALSKFWSRWGTQAELLMMRCLNVEQGAFFLQLAESNKQFEEFFDGWILNRVEV